MHIPIKNWMAGPLILCMSLWTAADVVAQTDSTSVPTSSQSSAPLNTDSARRVYNINGWVVGGISVAAAAAGILTISPRAKPNYTPAELAALNPNDVPAFDRWSLHQDASLIPTYENYSLILQVTAAAMPLTLLLDDKIREHGGDAILMALEVNAIVVSIYTVSPLGPLFQTRNRPVVYYHDPEPPVSRANGNNKNSFYSGHVASAAGASFCMAKIICDTHPELGSDKFWVYAAASVPPLAMTWVRLKALDHFPSDIAVGFAIGTICGIVIPELHRINDKSFSLAPYASPNGTGIALQWVPQ